MAFARQLKKTSQILPNLVTDPAERGEPLFFGPIESGGILEVVVNPRRLTWKNRAAFLGVVTDRQNIIEVLVGELVHTLGTGASDIDPDLPHHRNRLRPDLTRPGPGAFDQEPVA